jgi:hypothetical protein
MKATVKYAALCMVGTLAPLSAFVPWVIRHGLDARLFTQLLFANPVSAFFAMDVLVSAVVIMVWTRQEAKEGLRQWWAPILGTLLVGGSLGLPLLLFLREQQHRLRQGR